jgi:redox-sensitive bicupin YhaK (pirin superfamily)
MSNIQLIIEEQAANIGNFLVGRLLPFKQKRMIGPFIFLDHMGPAALKDYQNLDVPPHPHIGLSTLTYLFEGSIMHRDSLGTSLEIQPGAVNWMTAGNGVVHSERTPEYLRNTEKNLHGFQIWVALPLAHEDDDPNFVHIEASALPNWEENGVHYKLIAGSAFGKKSPVPVYSPLFFIEIKNGDQTREINIGSSLFGESGLYILSGSIKNNGHEYGEKQLLVTQESQLCSFEMSPNAIVYVFGGEPFNEDRHIFWNFVSSSKAKIEAAKEKWEKQLFPKVPGETTFVPLPNTTHLKLK